MLRQRCLVKRPVLLVGARSVGGTAVRRVVGAVSVGVAIAMTSGGVAFAASPTPSSLPSAPTCQPPMLTVTPTSGPIGTKVAVTGQHFSGCSGSGSSPKPSSVLPVQIGLTYRSSSAQPVTKVLATTKTTSTGSFTVTVVIPSGVPAGTAEVLATSKDPATGSAYGAGGPFTVTGSPAPTASPTPVPGPSPKPKPAPVPGPAGAPTGTVPRSVPAGSAGLAADQGTSPVDVAVIVLLGAAGLAVAVEGGRRWAISRH